MGGAYSQSEKNRLCKSKEPLYHACAVFIKRSDTSSPLSVELGILCLLSVLGILSVRRLSVQCEVYGSSRFPSFSYHLNLISLFLLLF